MPKTIVHNVLCLLEKLSWVSELTWNATFYRNNSAIATLFSLQWQLAS